MSLLCLEGIEKLGKREKEARNASIPNLVESSD
jgi:hypothetical protein